MKCTSKRNNVRIITDLGFKSNKNNKILILVCFLLHNYYDLFSVVLVLHCHLLRLLLQAALHLIYQLAINYIFIYIKPRIQHIHILAKEGRLSQTFLKTVDMLLDDTTLQTFQLNF